MYNVHEFLLCNLQIRSLTNAFHFYVSHMNLIAIFRLDKVESLALLPEYFVVLNCNQNAWEKNQGENVICSAEVYYFVQTLEDEFVALWRPGTFGP